MAEIISRSEAEAKELKRYFTGEQCKHGHILERFVVNGRCVQCVRDVTIAWRVADPEKVREMARNARRKNPEKDRERQHNAKNKNPAKYREMKRRLAAAWRERNPEKATESIRKVKRNNPEKYREIARVALRKRRRKKYCAELSARIDRGLESTKASGALLDLDTAMQLFKAQHNAFEFLE